MAAAKPELPVLTFASQQEWLVWLAEHHADSAGVWLRIARKDAGASSVSYAEALDVALRYGWIDGQKATSDGGFWRQRFTPRGRASRWSKINCAKAEALIEAGLMEPAGLREVEAARGDGRWDAAYAGQRTATVPEDLQTALDANEAARTFFATLSGVNRYAILYRVHDAKKPETRARRIATFVAMLAEGTTIYP